MTTHKLNKFIEKGYSLPHGERTLYPILVGDSKLKRLERASRHAVENEIYYNHEDGRNSQEGYEWIVNNLDRKIEKYGKVWVYVWLGTCDLSNKPKNSRFIYLTSQNYSAADRVISYYNRINDFINARPNARVTFLETPIYSIEERNSHHAHPESFRADDRKLEDQVYYLNGKIRELNTLNHCHSPSFSIDLVHTSKERIGPYRNEFRKKGK